MLPAIGYAIREQNRPILDDPAINAAEITFERANDPLRVERYVREHDFDLVSVHALIMAVGPIANVVALNVAYLISGVVVVETIFAYPGLARLMTDAVQARDMPIVQACAMIFSAAYVLLILLADILANAFDVRGTTARHRGGTLS